MKVFASNFFFLLSSDTIDKNQDWNWNPADNGVDKIVACGANTATRSSTYKDERDDRADADKPDEGMLVA